MGELMAFLAAGTFVLVFLMYAWPVLLIAVVAGLGIWVARMFMEADRIDRDYRKDTERAIVKRADTQHAQIMSGDDEAGTYGIYLPPKGMR